MKHLRRFWLFLVLGAAGFFAFQYKDALTASLPTIQHIGLGWLGFAACVQAGFWLVSSAAWQHLVRVNGIANVSLWSAFLQLAAVNVGKYVPGKVWGMVMRGGLLTRMGASVAKVIGATLHEQYVLLIAAAFIAGLFGFAIVPEYALVAATLGFAVLGLGFFLQRTCFALVGRWAPSATSGATRGDSALVPMSLSARSYYALTGYYGIAWLLNGLVLAALYVALFPAEVANTEDILVIIVANTLGITIGFFAIFAPSGIGVREGVSAWLLGLHFPFEQAIIVTVVFRICLVVIDLALVSVLGYVEMRRTR